MIIILILNFLSALSQEQKEYQELSRKFTREVILPQAAKYDQSGEVTQYIMIVVC